MSGSDLRLCNCEPLLSLSITEEFHGRFERFKIVRRDEHHELSSILRNVDPFMRPGDLVGNLGQPGLDL
jgi:hypothetical protein